MESASPSGVILAAAALVPYVGRTRDAVDAQNYPQAYKLAGPVPHGKDPEVKAIADAAWEGKMSVQFEQGLGLRIGATNPARDWYVSFYVTNANEHRFLEMSGEGVVFGGRYGNADLPEVVRYLASHGNPKQLRPAAPLPY